ncbi:hypothetical protein [Bifidobacterium callitrichidarum]|nr:hypothetical protein [Bifidobacterium callitrichidarum]
MGTNLGVSDLAKRINTAILSQMGIHRASNRELARLTGRSEKYIRDRINLDKEWAFGDVEIICNAWQLPIDQFINGAITGVTLTDEDRKLLLMAKLRKSNMALAANNDPFKMQEMEGGEGR